jgi:hypothetical protein
MTLSLSPLSVAASHAPVIATRAEGKVSIVGLQLIALTLNWSPIRAKTAQRLVKPQSALHNVSLVLG